jgi:hypothetical protein
MRGAIGNPGFPGRPRFVLASLVICLAFAPRGRGQTSSWPDPSPGFPNPGFEGMPSEDPFAPGGMEDSPYNSFSPERRHYSLLPIFFPPDPPRLDEALDSATVPEGRLAAPAELAAYVNEPFYAPLSTRLYEKNLKGQLRTRLDTYHAAKITLQKELRARLEALETADPAVRERELAAFARQQAPRIAELETAADGLRTGLIEGGVLHDSSDWNDYRRWQLGVSRFRTPAEAMLAQFQVMRAAVFYQAGLSSAQRRLLREVAMELAEITARLVQNGDEPNHPAADTDTNPPLFFFPETASLRLPADLPVELTRKISEYESKKSDLKKELRDALYAQDSAPFAFVRARALQSLAEQQQPRIAALEVLAEDIRHDLAAQTSLTRPPAPPALPPALAARLAALLQDKNDAQKSALALVQQVRQLISVAHVNVTKNSDARANLSVVISPQDRTEAKVKPVRDLISRYNTENSGRLEAIEKETAALHESVVQFVRAGPDAGDVDKAVKELLEESGDSIERQQEWTLYKDYRTAVLEPGLSPEQRRLLYDGGLEILDRPLPGTDRPVASLR